MSGRVSERRKLQRESGVDLQRVPPQVFLEQYHHILVRNLPQAGKELKGAEATIPGAQTVAGIICVSFRKGINLIPHRTSGGIIISYFLSSGAK